MSGLLAGDWVQMREKYGARVVRCTLNVGNFHLEV
jgi:hypothetical protein